MKCSQCLSQHASVCLSLIEDQNQNLTSAQKELLLWHFRLGHLSFQHVQWLMRPQNVNPLSPSQEGNKHRKPVQCIHPKHPQAASCEPPLCKSCEISKAKKRTTQTTSIKHNKEFVLRANHLTPGNCISVDQYESSIKGRIPNSRGKEAFGNKYSGGTIFYDHASGLIRCIHQVSLRAMDTITAKNIFEREARLCGVRVTSYHGDNGIFKSKEFTQALQSLDQTINLSGIGAHHQNGVAERAIRTVTERACTMMYHAHLHWPQTFSVDLWPYALDYAVWIHNHVPRQRHGWAPIEMFCSLTHDCAHLQRLKV